MKQYLDVMKDIMENGDVKGDRTGTGTISKFGAQMRFDLNEGFPLLTTKKMFLRGIIAELLWFIKGATDERELAEMTHGKPREEITDKGSIWLGNADKQGKDLGYPNTSHVTPLLLQNLYA